MPLSLYFHTPIPHHASSLVPSLIQRFKYLIHVVLVIMGRQVIETRISEPLNQTTLCVRLSQIPLDLSEQYPVQPCSDAYVKFYCNLFFRVT